MDELALFAGAGGSILAGKLIGWRTRCAVEIDPYCREVLLARQRDGHLEPFPIWDDIATFDGKPWAGSIDIITGGFPCQDISSASHKGTGIEGEQSGLWEEMARVIGEVRPRHVFVENSSMLLHGRGLDRILGDLSKQGFNAEWRVLGARDVGGLHKRDRIWILASHPDSKGEPTFALHAKAPGLQELAIAKQRKGRHGIEPRVGGVADDVAHRLDRLAAIGNGQVPAVAELAFNTLRG